MLVTLVALCIIFPIWIAHRRSSRGDAIEINHFTLFTFGFLFYWILPIAAGVFAKSFAESIPAGWYVLFPSDVAVRQYLIVCLVLYLSFLCGDMLSRRWLTDVQKDSRPVNRLTLYSATFFGVALSVFEGVTKRGALFSAYSADNQVERGTFTAYIMILGVVAILFLSDHDRLRLREFLCSRFVLPFMVGCLALLSIGSRLYVASFVLMFLVYRGCFVRPIRRKHLAALVLIIALLAGSIGVVRQDAPLSGVALNILHEPLLTSLSLVYFLRYEQIAWLNTPVYLAYDFINLVPSAVMPNKLEYLKSPDVYNPLGALHSFVSFNLNFGIVGSIGFMFTFPFLFQYLRARRSSQLFRVMYSMLSGCLAFTFFRDPFAVSLIKAMLENSIVFPFLICFLSWSVQSATGKSRTFSLGLQRSRLL